jgi:hypothetical protein
VNSFALSRSVTAWYLAIQAASSAGIRILKAAPPLSAMAGVKDAGSTLRLWLHNESEHENKEQNRLVKKQSKTLTRTWGSGV